MARWFRCSSRCGARRRCSTSCLRSRSGSAGRRSPRWRSACCDLQGLLHLNSRANLMVAALLYPLLAFTFLFAEDIITVLYTASYVEAASTMRVYSVGMAAMVVEIGSLVLLLQQGNYALRV